MEDKGSYNVRERNQEGMLIELCNQIYLYKQNATFLSQTDISWYLLKILFYLPTNFNLSIQPTNNGWLPARVSSK